MSDLVRISGRAVDGMQGGGRDVFTRAAIARRSNDSGRAPGVRGRVGVLLFVQCGSDRAKGTWVRTVVVIDSLKSAWSRFTERDVRSRPHQDAGLVQQGRIEVPAGPQRRRGSQRERPLSLGGRLVADLG